MVNFHPIVNKGGAFDVCNKSSTKTALENVSDVHLLSMGVLYSLQDSNTSSLDLGLCLKGHNSNSDSVGQRKEDQTKKASSGGFWTTG